MRTTSRALSWIVLGTVAFGCGGGGTSGSGTAGTSGGTGVAGTSGAAGTSGTAGTTGAAGTSGTAGTTGAAGTTGTGGTAGVGGTGGNGGSTGGRGGNGGGAAGNAGGAGGRGGAAGTGTAGGGGAGGGAGGRGGSGGGTGGGAGATNCTGHAISLSSNGTASDADTAQARIEIDLGTDLPTGNTQRTIEFWAFIKTTDWVGENNEVYYYGTGGTAASFGLDFGTNPVTGMNNNHATLNPFTGGGAFTVDSTADLGVNSSTDQWVHIAMVWNGTNVITYVNGQPKITASGGATALATGQSVLTIGCNPSNSRCFNGLFDEFRVWKVARSATEIQSNYNKPVAANSANLVGYWKFDEASGTTTADAVNAGGHTAHSGTLKADTTAHNPTFVTPPVPLPLVCQ